MIRRDSIAALLAATTILVGCGSGTTYQRWTPDPSTASDSEIADSLEVDAARARLEAARARENAGGAADSIGLRVNQLGTEDGEVSDNLEVSARLQFNSPAYVRANRDVYAANSDLAASDLAAVSLDQWAERCNESLDVLVGLERQQLYADLTDRVEEVTSWSEALEHEHLLDEIEANELRLDAQLTLIAERPTVLAAGEPHPSFQLPELRPPDGTLSVDEQVIQEQVQLHNPSVENRQLAANRYQAMARREQSRNRVYFDFVELIYEPLVDPSFDALSAQVGLSIPIPNGRSEQREYYELLSDAERLDEGALTARMVDIVLHALLTTADYEAQIDDASRLLAAADQAEAIANSWLSDRRGQPSQLLQLYSRAYEARIRVLVMRGQAGRAACTLRSASGVQLEDWPRYAESIGRDEVSEAVE